MSSEQSLQWVFLDVGGTLLSESTSRAALYAEEARRRGLDVDSGAMRSLMDRTHETLSRSPGPPFRYTRGWFERFIERIFVRELGLPPEDLGAVQEALFARFADPGTFRLAPGALALLDGLRARGLRLGVVSNWSEALPDILEALGVNERLEFALVSAVEHLEKPDPAIFRRALERAGVPASRALHAGNDPVHDGAALEAGIACVLVDRDGTLAPRTDLPCVADLDQLLEFVLKRA